jgi:hypothetical protein
MAAQRAQAEEQGSLEDRVWCVSGMLAEGGGLFPAGVDRMSVMGEERRRGGAVVTHRYLSLIARHTCSSYLFGQCVLSVLGIFLFPPE